MMCSRYQSSQTRCIVAVWLVSALWIETVGWYSEIVRIELECSTLTTTIGFIRCPQTILLSSLATFKVSSLVLSGRQFLPVLLRSMGLGVLSLTTLGGVCTQIIFGNVLPGPLSLVGIKPTCPSSGMTSFRYWRPLSPLSSVGLVASLAWLITASVPMPSWRTRNGRPVVAGLSGFSVQLSQIDFK